MSVAESRAQCLYTASEQYANIASDLTPPALWYSISSRGQTKPHSVNLENQKQATNTRFKTKQFDASGTTACVPSMAC